ncbi:hypothetical protein TSTA_017710 [Talaromyces stipitatus ATCC 10500]|uniref:Uncharacterized protein n=1 Tax=Talaromyces stipitatus (strain ATCC 10500 / CBS 375.48 / QM 6759 / NRRL 1006) TaxID=441959 RepID=B8MFG3_TALSN|nr:uncharacterized protein TSTA_017710 [Talaromyces stipitatus ATCC 10500]EED16697.1 hypothetical protein TSTA_017710 [Talaromyces stipitatus ATCC 10500]
MPDYRYSRLENDSDEDERQQSFAEPPKKGKDTYRYTAGGQHTLVLIQYVSNGT